MDWLPMHSGHPLMVHLPLAAFPMAIIADGVGIWKQDRSIRMIATILWWLALFGAAAAFATGLLASSRVEHSDLAHEVMTLHRNLALAALGLCLISGCARWRWPLSRVVVGIGGVGVAGIAAAGYLGGEIVYRHALGLPTAVLEQVMTERGGHGHDPMSEAAPPGRGVDSGAAGAAVESTAHTHDRPEPR
jgi:uncharacterized membrane protein